MFEQGEPLPAKKIKGLQELVLTKESPSTAHVCLPAPSSPCQGDNSTEKRDLKKRSLKRKAGDSQDSQNEKRFKTENNNEERGDYVRAKFREKYVELRKLGEGGYGTVFAGYRVYDELPVAIKHIQKTHDILMHKEKKGKQMPLEVAIMLKLRAKTTRSPEQSAILSMLDWYDMGEELIVVMERPMPAEDLFNYIQNHKGRITMNDAKIMIKQLLKTITYLQKAKIFHRDIKPSNILIETRSKVPKLYLIDFGLSCFVEGGHFRIFAGTFCHIPPEFKTQGFYTAGPTTVWQVGLVLYEILHQEQFVTRKYLSNELKINTSLSEKCREFLTKCLAIDPKERPTVEDLLHHQWLTEEDTQIKTEKSCILRNTHPSGLEPSTL
uniref:non-specific serine/threonine protein kinase n=1 Tax=Cyprinodon variegatus TaxID=28743 RepID=A0A3Q2FDH7_CYPVA